MSIKLVSPPLIDSLGNRAKVVLLRGLPGSGKSTYAKKLMQENPNRVFVLEKDRFREIWGFLPHGTVQQEAGIVWAIDGAAIQLLRHGATVVIDATNLSSWDMEHWQGVALYVGAEFECVDFTHVSIEECKENVRKRVSSGGRYVGDEIIDALAERAGLIKRNSNE